MVQYLHLTRQAEGRLREVYGNGSYQSEPEPMCSGDEESTLGFSDVDTELEECYPQTLYTCIIMEVEGCGCK